MKDMCVVSPRVQNLRDSVILMHITFDQTEGEAVGHLRSLKCLAVVEFDFITLLFPDEIGTAKGDLRRVQTETYLKLWKAHLVQVLKDSPSKERKFLRWKISERQMPYGVSEYTVIVVENGELEVLPETSL